MIQQKFALKLHKVYLFRTDQISVWHKYLFHSIRRCNERCSL